MVCPDSSMQSWRSSAGWWLPVAWTLLLAGCGVRFGGKPTPTPTPTVPALTATRQPGGIASGAAVGPQSVTTAAPALPATSVPAPGANVPPAAGGTCPSSHPVKIGHDERAHPPGSAGYDGVAPVACYADLQAAEANGYHAVGP
ncbi:MAG: hypothetical protein ACR2PL_13225 [Dehalococcoidia bacterium]